MCDFYLFMLSGVSGVNLGPQNGRPLKVSGFTKTLPTGSNSFSIILLFLFSTVTVWFNFLSTFLWSWSNFSWSESLQVLSTALQAPNHQQQIETLTEEHQHPPLGDQVKLSSSPGSHAKRELTNRKLWLIIPVWIAISMFYQYIQNPSKFLTYFRHSCFSTSKFK